MRAVANSPGFAKKVNVPQSVGKEFEMKGKAMPMRGQAMGLGKAAEMSKRRMPAAGRPMGMKKGGSIDGVAKKGKTHTTMVKMAKGGKAC